MKRLMGAVIGSLLAAQVAAECELEDWRFYDQSDHIIIEGATSCEAGQIILRVYDGSDEYIGNVSSVIRGYAFKAIMPGKTPASINLKYSFRE